LSRAGVAKTEQQIVQIDDTPGAAGRRLVETL
jgi:hypothetical protein